MLLYHSAANTFSVKIVFLNGKITSFTSNTMTPWKKRLLLGQNDERDQSLYCWLYVNCELNPRLSYFEHHLSEHFVHFLYFAGLRGSGHAPCVGL